LPYKVGKRVCLAVRDNCVPSLQHTSRISPRTNQLLNNTICRTCRQVALNSSVTRIPHISKPLNFLSTVHSKKSKSPNYPAIKHTSSNNYNISAIPSLPHIIPSPHLPLFFTPFPHIPLPTLSLISPEGDAGTSSPHPSSRALISPRSQCSAGCIHCGTRCCCSRM
jgi:hypothetical protein